MGYHLLVLRRAALGGCLIAVLGAVEASARAPRGWTPHMRAAIAFAKSRQGEVSFAVRTERRLYRFHAARTVPSASVVKAMLLIAYLNHPAVRHRDLRHADWALLSPMIRRSDNDAASAVSTYVGDWRLRLLAHRVGMRHFATNLIWGLTQICAADQTKLFLGLDRYVVKRHRAEAFTLLRTIHPSQRWGIARVRPRGWKLYFKGGWGSGTGLVDHQVGLLTRGDQRVSIAILTRANPSHAYGMATEEGIARRVLRGLAR